jgi:cell division protein DivIC
MNIKVPRIFRNFYFVTALVFILWLCLLDTNDLITQYTRKQRLEKLKEEKAYYSKEINRIEKAHQDAFDKPAVIEKIAREKYLLKKLKEEVYVIEEDTTKID